MREIKFRAWNGKEMIEPYSVKNGKAMIIKQCDKNDPVLTDGEGVNYYCNWDVDVETDYPLMQYTGLKDCEGTEIYEGDLIQLLKPKSKYFATVDFINAYVGGWVLTHKDTDNVLSLGARNPNELKVIGNIHQNPELLPTDTSSR